MGATLYSMAFEHQSCCASALTVTELKPLLRKMSTTRVRRSSRRAASKRWRGRVLTDLSTAVCTPVTGAEWFHTVSFLLLRFRRPSSIVGSGMVLFKVP